MSELAVIDSDAFKRIEEVAELRTSGLTEYAVAKKLGIKRTEVIELYDRWKDMLTEDSQARDMARDHLNVMVKHYDKLIQESYKILDDLNKMQFDEKVSAQKNITLKNISDYEARRVDALQKAGLLDANDLGEEMARMEEQKSILVDILQNDLCPGCKGKIAQKLGLVTGRVEAIVVDG